MRKIFGKTVPLVVLLVIFVIQTSEAQLAKFKSAYIYNICRYIEWPEGYREGNFIIGVVGKSEITEELEILAQQKKIVGQTIVIKQYKSVANVEKCHVLYISESQWKNLPEAVVKVGNNATLIFSEKEGSLDKGAAINFIEAENKLKFELKKVNATRQSLKLNSSLDKLASKVL